MLTCRAVIERLNDVQPTGLALPEPSPGPGSRRLSVASGNIAATAGGEVGGSASAAPASKAGRPNSRGGAPAAASSGDAAASPPVVVSSERELVQEVEGMVPLLSSLQVRWGVQGWRLLGAHTSDAGGWDRTG